MQKLWQRGRLDFLIRQGRNREAIALAKQANLICSGTAFIAWDDLEKVAISQKEIQQPVQLMETLSSWEFHAQLRAPFRAQAANICFESLFGNEPINYPLPSGLSMLDEPLGFDKFGFLTLANTKLTDYIWAEEASGVWSAWREFVARFLSWLRAEEASRFDELSPELLAILLVWPAADAARSPDSAVRLIAWMDQVGVAAEPDPALLRPALLALKGVMRAEGIPVA